jgi:uncharacterized repeat protein (TIGR03803 family)
LYGTTSASGGSGFTCINGPGCGTVFSVTLNGTEKVLHAFSGSGTDGFEPVAGLIEVHGTLYGTTEAGGQYGYGTVFSINQHGTEKVLYSFKGGNDGASPMASLIDVNATFYGTTSAGGTGSCNGGCGTVFSITP